VSGYGATLVSLEYLKPTPKQLTLCQNIFDAEEQKDFFEVTKNAHYGATCGRVAGRIAKA
jgi:galactose mutarotase-like enzyme